MCCCAQVGIHALHAQIGNQDIGGMPLRLTAVPGAPCLATSRVDEAVLAKAVAGQRCTALLTAFNEFGSPVCAGGAVMTAVLLSLGAPSSPGCPRQPSFLWAFGNTAEKPAWQELQRTEHALRREWF